jgi:hypothetical protein
MLEEVSRHRRPIEFEQVQHVDFRKGAKHGLPGLRKALGLTPVRDDVLDDPTARDDRLVNALAQAFSQGDSFARVGNTVAVVRQLGSTWPRPPAPSASSRGLSRLATDYRSGGDAADWILSAWNGPPTE